MIAIPPSWVAKFREVIAISERIEPASLFDETDREGFDAKRSHQKRRNLMWTHTYVETPVQEIAVSRSKKIHEAVQSCLQNGKCILPSWGMQDLMTHKAGGVQLSSVLRTRSLEAAGRNHTLLEVGKGLRAIHGFATAPSICICMYGI